MFLCKSVAESKYLWWVGIKKIRCASENYAKDVKRFSAVCGNEGDTCSLQSSVTYICKEGNCYLP